MTSDRSRHKPATRAAHIARPRDLTQGLVNPGVFRGSTVVFEDSQALKTPPTLGGKRYGYGRQGTANARLLEEALTDLEGGHDCQVAGNGVQIIATVLQAFLASGDQVLLPDNVYVSSRTFASKFLAPRGIQVTYYNSQDPDHLAHVATDRARLLVLEAPGSMTFEVPELSALIAFAHKRGLVTMLDNTWATPLFLRPLDLGVDISVHAGTKYIVGHSDAFMGAAICNRQTWDQVNQTAILTGAIASPDDCWLALRGVRTMVTRVEQHQRAALAVARWLEDTQPEVVQVLHPGLPSHPDHDRWKRYFTGSTGLFSMILEGHDPAATAAFVDGLDLFGIGYSWGGYESLALPSDPTAIRTTTGWQAPGDLVRLHIGLEAVEDLQEDLAAGLDRRRQQRQG